MVRLQRRLVISKPQVLKFIPYGEILRVYTTNDGKTVVIEVEENGKLEEIEYERREVERIEIRL